MEKNDNCIGENGNYPKKSVFCQVPRAERVVELCFEHGEIDASVQEVEYGRSLEVKTGKGNRFYERWRREKGI